ncbi:MAG TPA: hypothetical protein VF778_05930 [Xanthobacteraceae bacterium]
MDDETRQYLAEMEKRIMHVFSNGAYALHERMMTLENAAVQLREQIERLVDHVEDTREPYGRG